MVNAQEVEKRHAYDFDELINNDNIDRTYSNIESNENNDKGNIAGLSHISNNNSGTKSRYPYSNL